MNNESEQLESFLKRVIIEISKLDAPIIFKGGLALKDILNNINPDETIERRTIDIDGNWIGEVDSHKVTDVLIQAVKNVDSSYSVELYRNAGENQSMGYRILDHENEVITEIDLDMKQNPFYVIAQINHVNVKYSSIEKIFADKLSVLSGPRVFRRSKDLLDVYLILKNQSIPMEKVKEILDYDKRKLGDFSTMLQNKEDVKHAYDTLKEITNKPEFEEVWKEITDFLRANHLL